MPIRTRRNDPFTLEIGGDECDLDLFQLLERTSFSLAYKGSRDWVEQGVQSILYEFEFTGEPLRYANGQSVGDKLFMTLNEPPGQSERNAQAARVALIAQNNSLIEVGRASLWRA